MTEAVQAEIDKYIKTQGELFDAIKLSTEPIVDPGKIEYTAPETALTISALNTNRNEQEKFLKQYQEQYNFITNLREKYAKSLDETNAMLAEQTSELSELEIEKKNLATGATTEYRRLKTDKYNQSKQQYYYHLYLICGIIQLVVVGFLVLSVVGIIPRATGLVVFLMSVLGLGIYIIYYIFFSSRARDIMVFDRYRFPVEGDGLGACPSSVNNEKTRRKNEELDAKIAGILTENGGECPVKLVSDDTEMPELPTTTTTTSSETTPTT